jgi:hypothetical protein
VTVLAQELGVQLSKLVLLMDTPWALLWDKKMAKELEIQLCRWDSLSVQKLEDLKA